MTPTPRMKANHYPAKAPYHHRPEHAWCDSCDQDPKCLPVEPAPTADPVKAERVEAKGTDAPATGSMSPKEQRIAIAEACGWVRKENPKYVFFYYAEGGKHLPYGATPSYNLPDYLHDLNAMHEAEKVLDGDPLDGGSAQYTYSHHLYNMMGTCQPFRSTAAQRAEAFLRTIGKWKPTAEQAQSPQ